MKSKSFLPALVLTLIVLTLISCKIIELCLNVITIEKPSLTYDMLTEEEKAQFRRIRNRYSEENAFKIFQRFQQDPIREGAFERAERNSLDDKLTREAAQIVRAFREPRRILDTTHQFFAGRTGDPWRISALDVGVGIFDIGVGMIIAPGRILGQWVSGEENDTPIQDVAQFLLLPILLAIAAWRAKQIRGSIVRKFVRVR